jgi:hypothetical protein
MADLGGYIVLDKNNIEKDSLYIYGDPKTIALILTLVDSSLVIEPKITGKASYLKILRNPPKNITLKLGNEKISKEILLSALQFAGIIK